MSQASTISNRPTAAVDGPYGDIVYLTEGPDGALYYVDLGYSDVGGTFGISKIRRIQFIQSDLPPVVAGVSYIRSEVQARSRSISPAPVPSIRKASR